MPSPVGIPQFNPAGSSPGAGGTKPSTPAVQAASACPSSPNITTNPAALLALETAASSAVHAESSDVKRAIAELAAPSVRSDCHSSVRRPASAGDGLCRFVM